jgi:hypothetical protein
MREESVSSNSKKVKAVKCAIKACPNMSNEGKFMDSLCGPCHALVIRYGVKKAEKMRADQMRIAMKGGGDQ